VVGRLSGRHPRHPELGAAGRRIPWYHEGLSGEAERSIPCYHEGLSCTAERRIPSHPEGFPRDPAGRTFARAEAHGYEPAVTSARATISEGLWSLIGEVLTELAENLPLSA